MIREFNHWLDAIPRYDYRLQAHRISVFRTCGLVGYGLAVLVCLGLTLATNASLAIALATCAIAGVSFFFYAWLRKLIVGRESLVLLEHVWVAFASVAILAHFCSASVARCWDVTSVGMCAFLAAGRCGCLLVGCCHGLPCALGIRYPDALPKPLGSDWRNGLRLFPVQLVESASLLLIGIVGACLIQYPGRATAWFISAYAVVRFALESLRGDRRIQLGGLSQAQWMSAIQLGFALEYSLVMNPLARSAMVISTATVWAAIATVVIALALRRYRLRVPACISEEIAQAVLDCQSELAELAQRERLAHPIVSSPRVLTHQFKLVATEYAGASKDWVHIAVGRETDFDLYALCQLACRALPTLDSASGMLTESNVLHLRVGPPAQQNGAAPDVEERANRLYGAVLTRLYA